MMAQFNALERTWPQWEALFRDADKRFQLQKPRVQDSAFFLIEAIWIPEGDL